MSEKNLLKIKLKMEILLTDRAGYEAFNQTHHQKYDHKPFDAIKEGLMALVKELDECIEQEKKEDIVESLKGAGKYFNGVDPVEYVKNLRGEEDEKGDAVLCPVCVQKQKHAETCELGKLLREVEG